MDPPDVSQFFPIFVLLLVLESELRGQEKPSQQYTTDVGTNLFAVIESNQPKNSTAGR
jgi:hypothetical protein